MEFELKLVTDIDTAQDYLKGILWSIFFHRLFGSIVPQDNHNFLGVPYPTTEFPELDRLIESKIDCIVGELAGKNRDSDNEELIYKCVIVVKFYEKSTVLESVGEPQILKGGNVASQSSRSNSQSGSSSSILMPQRTRKYQNCWEKWVLTVTILNNRNSRMLEMDNNSRLDFYKEDFERNLFKLIAYMDKNKSHIPPIQSIDRSPFPYKILFALNTHDSSSLDTAFASFETLSDRQSPDTRGSSNSESQGSVEYITTTEGGDIIMGNPGNNGDDPKTSGYRAIPSGEEMLRNGYKFLRKFLE
ncbi:DEKNAAC102533 [Brettanomyces naardenensis]|uniref:Autophagy-related protein 101 n=1 Tax=Brettanomyces naardenensis TaxID=13370 RepID=A0A448YKG1_BRENA|nr:DEKNAAC102533 [Brettanomyces naardenensis]